MLHEFVGVLGIEPSQYGPKPYVLPVYDTPIDFETNIPILHSNKLFVNSRIAKSRLKRDFATIFRKIYFIASFNAFPAVNFGIDIAGI